MKNSQPKSRSKSVQAAGTRRKNSTPKATVRRREVNARPLTEIIADMNAGLDAILQKAGVNKRAIAAPMKKIAEAQDELTRRDEALVRQNKRRQMQLDAAVQKLGNTTTPAMAPDQGDAPPTPAKRRASPGTRRKQPGALIDAAQPQQDAPGAL